MKTKLYGFLILSFCLISSVSCKDSDDNTSTRGQQTVGDDEYVNNWIYKEMSEVYYWADKMPLSNNLDYQKAPDDFFKSILYPYNKLVKDGDRFSWIQNNYQDLLNALSGVSRDIGFEYAAFQNDKESNHVFFKVLYTKPNTIAYSKLQRDDIISKVGGEFITEDNYRNILRSGKSEYELTVLKSGETQTQQITISVYDNYSENPIYYTNVYQKSGKKIGYIMYNQFTPDNGDGSYKYDIALIDKFAEFKAQNITDLVLDLRYNGGGYTSCALNIASAIVKDRKTSNVFAREEWNDLYQDYWNHKYGEDYLKDYFIEKLEISRGKSYIIPSLNLPKIYILVSDNTASASEMIINGLSPYMDVVLIGETTYGKNMGSITIYEKNDSKNKWAMQPIVFRIYNGNNQSDYAGGFEPQYPIKESDFQMKPIGDENEVMLATAIAVITHSPLPVRTKSQIELSQIANSLERKVGAYQMISTKGDLINEKNNQYISK